MGLLRLSVLGAPEVFHDGSRLSFPLRKAQALQLYLAVEGGLHQRSQLDAFLWPDSEPHEAPAALRNAIALLRHRLEDPVASPSSSHHTHLVSPHDLLGLDPHAPLELELDVVQQAWKQAHTLFLVSSLEQRAALVATLQLAISLVRGPFLDGFLLREEAPFDEWHEQQQQWQVQNSIASGRMAIAVSKESKNIWTHIFSTHCLTYGLLEVGAYEEALLLMLQVLALARSLPPTLNLYRFLTALGGIYQGLQQWEKAEAALQEAEALAETLDLRSSRVSGLSQLCLNSAVAGRWEEAYSYTLKAIGIRKNYDAPLILMDFYRHYETEALLRGGDERQARAEVQRLREGLGSNQRFRIPYLRSLALLEAGEGQREPAIGHLGAAAQVAADLGLPGEQWQIQAALGREYEAGGHPTQALAAFGQAASIIERLAEAIGDEARRSHFLASASRHL